MVRLRILFCIASALFSIPTEASIIKKPPVKVTEPSYKDLVCTESQKACIYEIISTMADNSKLSLLFKQNHLKSLGDQISDVHPMKFLSTIFSDYYLKICMINIWNDHFKRNGFLDGLGPSLTREMEKGKLLFHLADFGAEIGVSEEAMRPYFESQDWENLVAFLIQPR